MPGFDIYLGDVNVKQGILVVSGLHGLTQRAEYDNQPLFLPDGEHLLYTAAILADGKEQTDSMLADLTTGEVKNLTNSPASEYSPTLMPDGKNFSVIWANDKKQKLYRYPLFPELPTAIPASELLKDVEPVGYQAWIDKSRVLLFVLGEPHTLQLANIDDQTSTVIDSNIGASLFNIPGTDLMSYSAQSKTSETDEQSKWYLKSFDPNTQKTAVLTELPKDAYYYGWSGDGKAIVAQGSKLLQWDRLVPDAKWTVFADVSDKCANGVSRLTTNAQNTKIALVCAK